MPFGLNKSGVVFCRMVRELLQGLPNVESYIDDLTIHTPDWEGHLDAVRRVLERLRHHSLTARPTKCEVGYNEINLLGQVVGKGRAFRIVLEKRIEYGRIRHFNN